MKSIIFISLFLASCASVDNKIGSESIQDFVKNRNGATFSNYSLRGDRTAFIIANDASKISSICSRSGGRLTKDIDSRDDAHYYSCFKNTENLWSMSIWYGIKSAEKSVIDGKLLLDFVVQTELVDYSKILAIRSHKEKAVTAARELEQKVRIQSQQRQELAQKKLREQNRQFHDNLKAGDYGFLGNRRVMVVEVKKPLAYVQVLQSKIYPNLQDSMQYVQITELTNECQSLCH